MEREREDVKAGGESDPGGETLAKWEAQILPTCVLLTLTLPHQKQ